MAGRIATIAFLIALMVLVPERGSAATLDLTGETLTGSISVTGSCTVPTATITFTATGAASGPYPGTFTASGSITYGESGASTPGAREIISVDEQFTITSGSTTISGTKHLIVGGGSCYPAGTGISLYTTVLDYQAQIGSGNSAATDRGQTSMDVLVIPESSTNTFSETFTSNREVVGDLITTVQGLGLPKGTTQMLTASLSAALASVTRGNITAACNQLDAFIQKVNDAAAANTLTPDDAAALLAQADALRASLGCT